MSGSNPLAAALSQVGQSSPFTVANNLADLSTKAQALKTSQFNLGQAQQGLAYDAMRRLAMTNPDPTNEDIQAALGEATRLGGNSDGVISNLTAFTARGGKPADFVRSYATGGMSPENQVLIGIGQPTRVETRQGILLGTQGGPLSATPGQFTLQTGIQEGLSPEQWATPTQVWNPKTQTYTTQPFGQAYGYPQPPGLGGASSAVAPSGGGAGGGGQGTSASAAVNNFGNIRAPNGGFASYATPQDGVAAMAQNLTAYQDSHGINTLNGITARWAPKGDGANDPIAYANTISKLTGIDPNAQLDLHDPATLAKIIPAMAQVEHGRPMGVGNDVLAAGITAGLSGRGGGAVAAGPGGGRGGPFIGATSAQPVAGGGAVRPAGGPQWLDPMGRPTAPGGAGGGPGFRSLPVPAPGQVGSLEAAADASTRQYSADNAAAGQFQQRVWPLVQAANILATNAPTTGQGADAVRSIIGHLQTLGNIFTGGDITNIGQSKFEELGKYMQQAVNASPFAAGSNDKLAAAITGSPNTHMTNLANQDVLKAMIGLERMKQMAITDFNNQGGQPMNWTNFLRQWQTSHDPRAFIFDMLPADKRKQLVDSMKSPAERQNFANTLTLVESNPGVMIRPAMPQ